MWWVPGPGPKLKTLGWRVQASLAATARLRLE